MGLECQQFASRVVFLTSRRFGGWILCHAILFLKHALYHGLLSWCPLSQIEEFVSKANEPDGEQLRQERTYESKTSGVRDVLCEHKDSGVPHFAHGLCRECYNDVNPFFLIFIFLIFAQIS